MSFITLDPMKRQILQQSHYNITSCTYRLQQLQRQLQTRYLEQQFAISMNAMSKLIQEQSLLIFHLKEQIKVLESKNLECLKLTKLVLQLEETILRLEEQRFIDQEKNKIDLNKLRMQSRDLHQILNQITKESSKLFQLKLKLGQRNQLSQGRFRKTIQLHSSLIQEYQNTSSMNKNKKQINKVVKNDIQSIKSENTKLTQNFLIQNSNYEANKRMLQLLDKQVRQLQQQREKHKYIVTVAEKDNQNLKQSLKLKIQNMKQKQEQLIKLQQVREQLFNTKNLQKQVLEVQAKQSEQSKLKLNQQILNGQNLQKYFQQLVQQKYMTQNDIEKLQFIIFEETQRKQLHLKHCSQNQQQFQRQIYYIDQYFILNSQLIKEIDILVSEQIHKQNLQDHYRTNFRQRTNVILNLKEFITKAREQMWNSQGIIRQMKQVYYDNKLEV